MRFKLLEGFYDYLTQSIITGQEERKLMALLARSGQYVIFGGALRDYFFGLGADIFSRPRDIDIVTNSDNTLDLVERHFSIRRNRFGGIKVEFEGNSFDIWSIRSAWVMSEHLKSNPLAMPSLTLPFDIGAVPHMSFFNVTAIAYAPNTRQFYDAGFWKCYESRILDIVYEKNPFPELCAVNAALYCCRYDLRLSSRLSKLLKKYWRDSPTVYDSIQLSHFGKVRIDFDTLREFVLSYPERISKPIDHYQIELNLPRLRPIECKLMSEKF